MTKLNYVLPLLAAVGFIGLVIRSAFALWAKPEFTRNDSKPLSLLYVLAIIPAAFVAMMSIAMFDAPGSEKVLSNQLSFLAIAAFPFSLIIGLISGFRRDPNKVLVLLPILIFLTIIIPKTLYFFRWWIAL